MAIYGNASGALPACIPRLRDQDDRLTRRQSRVRLRSTPSGPAEHDAASDRQQAEVLLLVRAQPSAAQTQPGAVHQHRHVRAVVLSASCLALPSPVVSSHKPGYKRDQQEYGHEEDGR